MNWPQTEEQFKNTNDLFSRNTLTIQYPKINPFVPHAPFLYPLKISENRKVFWCFQGVEKGCIGNERVKT